MTDVHLLNDMSLALAFALGGGLVARWLRLPPIVGYLVAGIVIGPFTPGYVADSKVITELAEIGVVFLMFGVGMHFSLHELLAVRRIAVPGAIGQTTIAALAGTAVALAFGLSLREGVVLGLAISVASTVVLIRALEGHNLHESGVGRVSIGWLIVEDLATVLFLVLLPSLRGAGTAADSLKDAAMAIGGAALFLAVTLGAGSRLAPWFFHAVQRTHSRELFLLAVIATGLGIATGATQFGVSVALGAFVAGVLIGDTDASYAAAADVVPFRDAFAVLFFVSVGMLVDPAIVAQHLGQLAAVVGVVLVVKFVAAVGLATALGVPLRGALVIAAGLAQVGEFSFILLQGGFDVDLVSVGTYNVVLGASVISIVLNPLLFKVVVAVPEKTPPLAAAVAG